VRSCDLRSFRTKRLDPCIEKARSTLVFLIPSTSHIPIFIIATLLVQEMQESSKALRHQLSADQIRDRRKSGERRPNKLRRRSLYHDPETRSLRRSLSIKRPNGQENGVEVFEVVNKAPASAAENPGGNSLQKRLKLIQ